MEPFRSNNQIMENYSKGKNVEEPLNRENLPIPNLPDDFVWMEVKAGSRMRNILEAGLVAGRSGSTVVWTGKGPALHKAISCAEIMKTRLPDLHQYNSVHFNRCEEHWDPKIDGLDPLVVTRDVPVIHIMLSKKPINQDLPGYQPSGVKNWIREEGSGGKKKFGGRGGGRGQRGGRGGNRPRPMRQTT